MIKWNKIKCFYRNWMALGRPKKFLLAFFLRYTGLSSLFVITTKYFKIRFRSSAVATVYFYDKKYLDHDTILYETVLNRDSVVIDVGANIGTHSLVAATIAAQGTVYAFEPLHRVYAYLLENIVLNKKDNIIPLNKGLGDCKEKVFFSDLNDDVQNQVLDKGGRQVSILRLDDVLPSKLFIDLIKIDVEGYEKFVLLGASSVLKRTKCVYAELSDKTRDYGYRVSEILFLLKKQGFGLFIINERGGLSPLVGTSFNKKINVLAIKKPYQKEIIDRFAKNTL